MKHRASINDCSSTALPLLIAVFPPTGNSQNRQPARIPIHIRFYQPGQSRPARYGVCRQAPAMHTYTLQNMMYLPGPG